MQITLDGSSTTPGATFSWTAIGDGDEDGNGIISRANTATPLVEESGTYVLTVTNPGMNLLGQVVLVPQGW